MKNRLIATLLVAGLIAVSACSQKKIATVDQPQASVPPAAVQTRPAEKPAEKLPPSKIPVDAVTSSENDRNNPIPGYVRELQKKLNDVYFDYDKYDLSDDGKKAVRTVADILSKNRKVKVTIEGHCDERGTNEYNLALGDRRAKATNDYLSSLGIPAVKIASISYGEEKPACSESSEACWAKNRRAHFALSE